MTYKSSYTSYNSYSSYCGGGSYGFSGSSYGSYGYGGYSYGGSYSAPTSTKSYFNCNTSSGYGSYGSWASWCDYKTPEPATIKGRLTYDADGNDTEWNAETKSWDAGIEGKTVELIDSTGTVVATAVTDAHGNYTLSTAPGQYQVRFPGVAGYEFSQKDAGPDGYDSDADAAGLTDVFSVSSGQTVCNIDAGLKAATGTISGTVFCDTDCDGLSEETTTVAGKTYTVEAEDMQDCNFDTVSGSQASGGLLVKLRSTSYSIDGTLKTNFAGENGTYDIKIAVQDENDGQSKIYVKVNGQFVEAIRLDGDNDGAGSNHGGFSTYVIKDVALKSGDQIMLAVDGNCGEYVRIDKLDFVGADVVTTVSEPVKAGVTIKLLDGAGVVIATTLTDANGAYSFETVPVGEYTIMGVAPDGTEFTIQDVDGNSQDGIDSDVNGDGVSGAVVVTAGSNSTIDLGVCDKPEPVLGALGDRVFFDLNRDGIQNDGETGVAGVAVTLAGAGADGVFGTADDIAASTTTAEDGTYLFDQLAAGDYVVTFAEVDAFDFTTANAGDDAADSDADQTTGQTAVITLAAGQIDLTWDAGIVSENPEAAGDTARTCADHAVTVDVLANDTDEQALTITAVGGIAITEGATVDVDGVFVSLIGGKLVVDGAAAYAALDIGQEATKTIAYTVSDGLGGSATADLDVTFCGDANSYASLVASFPTTGGYEIAYGLDLNPFGDFGFDIRISGTGDDRFDGVIFEQAYCLDFATAAETSGSFDTTPVNPGAFFGVQSAEALGVFSFGQTSAANGQAAADNLDLVNWVIAQGFEDNGAESVNGEFSGWEVQFAIWELLDGFNSDAAFNATPSFGQLADTDYIVNQALAHGEGFEFGTEGQVGLIIDPSPSTVDNVQPFIIGLGFEAYDCLC